MRHGPMPEHDPGPGPVPHSGRWRLTKLLRTENSHLGRGRQEDDKPSDRESGRVRRGGGRGEGDINRRHTEI